MAADREAASAELKELIRDIANVVFPRQLPSNIYYNNQRSATLFGKLKINADYVLYCTTAPERRKVLLEIQGGGETSSTGSITRHVASWEDSTVRTNEMLRQPLSKPGVIPNNAWKRQLEQILRKANVAHRLNAGFALAMGELLYRYVDLIVPCGEREFFPEWEVCFVELKEVDPKDSEHPARFHVSRQKYMLFDTFIDAISRFPIRKELRNIFEGSYVSLENQSWDLLADEDPVVAERVPEIDIEAKVSEDIVGEDDDTGEEALI